MSERGGKFMPQKFCVLDETKLCTDCGACDRCDLDPNKICDNCMKCLEEEGGDGYRSLKVGKIMLQGAAYEKWLSEDAPDENNQAE